jgi:hypothetical protein
LNVEEVNLLFLLLGRGRFHDEAATAATAGVAEMVDTDRDVAVQLGHAIARSLVKAQSALVAW